MAKRALVLGGGGSVGIAWETGLAAGLADEGIDLRLADKIVGTSAGSFVGAELASGRSPAELRARLTEGARARARSEFDVERAAGAGSHEADGFHGARAEGRSGSAETARRDRRVRARSRDDSGRSLHRLLRVRRRCAVAGQVRCTAVDAHDGRFVVLDQSTGTSLARGVASSCSVPGLFPPITINGRRYVDGGMRSATNFDLAEGYERVIAVAVIPPGGAAFMAARIDPELAQLRRSGSHVELITPDAASLDVFGPNLMDASRQAAALDAGVKQGRAEAVRIRSVWA